MLNLKSDLFNLVLFRVSILRRFLFRGAIPLLLMFFMGGCVTETDDIHSLADLKGARVFAVPTGTAADQFVLKRFPDARVTYYNSVYDCALAVKNGRADAAVYDKPVLKNIAAKNQGLTVLDEVLFPDQYGFAVAMDDTVLKNAADATLSEIRQNGIYDEMLARWFPDHGDPGPMPVFPQQSTEGVLLFGTAAVTEPMSYVDSSHNIAGFDIELAQRIALRMNLKLELVNMEFGAMLPALISGKVRMIGAGLSITEERAKSVLFGESYYESGIAALVRSPKHVVAADETVGDQQADQPIEYQNLGVLMGSIHEGYAKKRYPDARIHSFNTVTDMLAALNAEKIDGSFSDQSAVREILSQHDAFVVLETSLFETDIAAGFHKQQNQLRNQFNQFLQSIKSDGTHEVMVNRWTVESGMQMPDIEINLQGPVLKVGVSSDLGLPMSAKVNNQWFGLDIELSKRFASAIGHQIEFVDLPFSSLLPSLVTGKIDMIAASMMISPERSKQINFSDPYYASSATLLGKSKGDQSLHMASDGGEESFLSRFGSRFYSNLILEKRYLLILRGVYVTMLITLFAALLGTILGGLVCAGRMSGNQLLQKTARFFIGLIRGTPVLVLLMIIYYVVFASVHISPVLVAIVAFGVNFAAYVSEMFRTSIESIGRGQREAGIATGFSEVQTFILIVMPQAIRRVLPVYKGEFISLLKMTSVVGYIAVEDLTKASDIIRSRTFDAFFPLIMAAVIYILLSWLLSVGLSRIEINLDPVRKINRLKTRRSNTI